MSDASKLPNPQMALLLAVTLNEALANTILFPFVPQMVASFGVANQDVGFFAGLLASAYNLAQMPGNVIWGIASDKYGREPFLAIGVLSLTLSTVFFGMSHSLSTALTARVAGGILCGNSGLARAAMRDVTTDENRSKGFARLGLAWGVGFLIGPLLGGGLSNPAEIIPHLKGTFLDRSPYLLPCLVTCIPGVASLILLKFVKLKIPNRNATLPAVKESLDLELSKPGTTSTKVSNGDDVYEELERTREENAGIGPVSQDAGGRKECCWCAPKVQLLGKADTSGSRGGQILIYLVIVATFLMNFVVVAMQELFPLIASSERPSGLALTPRDIAGALSPLGISLLLMPFAYPKLDSKLGTVGTLRFGCVIFLLINIGMPLLVVPRDERIIWAGLWMIAIARGAAGMSTFASLSIMLNKVITRNAGFYNGMSASSQSLGRALAPMICGTLFAISQRMHAHIHIMPFAVIVVLCIVAMLLSLSFRTENSPGK